MKLNDTTMNYSRQASHYKPEQETISGPFTHDKGGNQAEFWVYVTLAFACGFLVCYLTK